MSGGGRDPVKVKIIDTEYVQTDPINFKSVVQKLTGKDAVASKADGSSARHNTAGPATSGVAVRPSREFLSQEDFDKMLKEMPSVDELYRLWIDQ
ncbi:VQ motif-containing protein 1-like [Macadamia integrifolia]|uniref:VQ motif-containing protein 1-like n=1 Tax=Macadamia integrifolia TaxID=60698 RepID=UPI001C533CC3|nr:VQ motif-containing protein 1-like [Macadamia integrifolia]